MKKLLLALLALAVLGSALYFALSSKDGAPPPLTIPGPAETTQADGPLEDQPVKAPLLETPLQPAITALDAPLGDQRAAASLQPGAALPEDRRCTLRVQVDRPAGTPADDGAEIVVVRPSIGAGADDDETDVLREIARLDPAAVPPSWLIARAMLEADGTATVQLERADAPLEVVYTARFTYVDERAKVTTNEPQASASFRPKLGACVVGRLIAPADADGDERNLEGAKIELRTDPLSAMSQPGTFDETRMVARDGDARSDGSFELRGIPPAKALTLAGVPSRLAAFKVDPFDLAAGQLRSMEITLERGAVVSGRVVDDEDRPIADAKLELRMDTVAFGFGGRTVRKGKSAADGSFRLEAVAAGKLRLDGDSDQHMQSTLDIERVGTTPIEGLVLRLSRGAAIAGRVQLPDGGPASQAKVEVSFDQAALIGMAAFNAARGGEGKAETNATGAFHVGALGKGPFTVKASATIGEGDASRVWSARADGVKPGTLDLVLTLAEPVAIAGRVVDDAGIAVSECTVEIERKRRNPFIPSTETKRDTVDGPEGRFEFDQLEPGAFSLTARRPGGFASTPLDVTLPRAATDGEVVLTLPRPSRVVGRVLTPDGSPAGGARVSRVIGVAEMQSGMNPATQPKTTTDDDGRFEMLDLPLGPVVLQAAKEGFAQSDSAALNLAAGQSIEDVVLRLRIGGTIEGEIFGASGQPESGARILAQVPDLRFGQVWTQSDGQGRFRFEHVAPGSWQVISMDFDQAFNEPVEGESETAASLKMLDRMKFASAEVKDGETAHVVLGARAKDPVRVHGRVEAAGRGVSDAMISFFPAGGGKKSSGLSGLKMKATDADGRYEVTVDSPGAYLVSVQKVGDMGTQQSVEFSREIPEVADHALDLAMPIGAIQGRVVDPDGAALAGVRVSLAVDGPVRSGTLVGGRYSEIQTDERGEYRLEWLAPGRYSVFVGGNQFGLGESAGNGTWARQVRDGVEIAEGQSVSNVDFRMSRGAQIEGRVVDGSGQPVAEAAIFVRDAAGRPIERISMTSTDAGGQFVQRGLGEGRYSVSARSADRVSHSEVFVDVGAEGAAAVELRLDEGATLLVTLDSKASTFPEVSFLVRDAKGRQVNGLYSLSDLMRLFNEGGFEARQQRFGPLAPGKYSVEATTAEGRTIQRSVTLVGGVERKVKLDLDD